jgi:subtilase family serine protease
MGPSRGKVRFGAIAISSAALIAAMLAVATPVRAQTISLQGTVAPDATRLKPVGHADPAKVMTMEIEFMPRNQAELDALIAAQQNPSSSQYHKWLTHHEYTRRFGPTKQDFNAVADWLKSSGFQVTRGSRREGMVRFSGTVAAVEKAFNARIMTFGDGSQFANTTEPEIPAAFAGLFGYVAGLQNLGRLEPALKRSRIHGLPEA